MKWAMRLLFFSLALVGCAGPNAGDPDPAQNKFWANQLMSYEHAAQGYGCDPATCLDYDICRQANEHFRRQSSVLAALGAEQSVRVIDPLTGGFISLTQTQRADRCAAAMDMIGEVRKSLK